MPIANMALLYESNLHPPKRFKRRRSGNEFPHNTGLARKVRRMKMKTFAAAIVAALFPFGLAAYSQVTAHPIPRIVQQNGRYALMVDGAPFLMLGAQANNSSDWPATLPKVWPAIEYLHANTLEIPIYWEQFEPRQGQFDYSQIDSVLAQARAHRVHLVLLWFGTWKNGSQHYMPEWMKLDPERYSHVVNRNGERVDSPSPFARASLDADVRAFTAFMRHLKAASSSPPSTPSTATLRHHKRERWRMRSG